MMRGVLAFEVFHGTTAEAVLGADFLQVFKLYKFELTYFVAVVTDTAVNMNTFGEYLHQRGVCHLYCVNHFLHLHA